MSGVVVPAGESRPASDGAPRPSRSRPASDSGPPPSARSDRLRPQRADVSADGSRRVFSHGLDDGRLGLSAVIFPENVEVHFGLSGGSPHFTEITHGGREVYSAAQLAARAAGSLGDEIEIISLGGDKKLIVYADGSIQVFQGERKISQLAANGLQQTYTLDGGVEREYQAAIPKE